MGRAVGDDRFATIPNDELAMLIDKWVRGERNRAILKRRLIDLVHYEPLAEEFDLSVRHVKSIVHSCEEKLFTNITLK